MVTVPQTTVEKPLTAIDYIAVLAQCQDFHELTRYAAKVPSAIVEDERFARAFKNRLDELKGRAAA